MYYYGARYYDPTLRRFITPDTLVQSPYDPQSLNRYAYCRNNPFIYVDPSGHWRLDNFLVSTLQVASYASMFAGGWGMPIAIASSMAQTGLQGGHLDDAIQAGAIGGVSSLIGQGVVLGIGPAGLGEGFGRTVVAGAGAGFASGGIGALMSGQSGSAVWQSAFQGAAMGAATAGVMWGITQGNSEIANYRKLVAGLREARAAAKSLDISGYPMYAKAGDWWDPRTYIDISHSQSFLFEGETTNTNGVVQKTRSLDLLGVSFDLSIGILPPPTSSPLEVTFGLGKHFLGSVGIMFSDPNGMGSFDYGAIVIHFGLGIGPPVSFSGTYPAE